VPTTTANPSVVAARPAETLTIAGAIAFLIARTLGVDNDTTMTAITMVIAFIPAAVTWLVELFSRGTQAADARTTTSPADPVAEQLGELNKTLREALTARPTGDSNGAVVEPSELVDAVDRILTAREEKRDARETMTDFVKAIREATQAFAEARTSTTRSTA
jgi:hypothetical protein